MKRKILEQCLKIAREKIKRHPEFKYFLHYSFVIQGGGILGVGFNRKSSPEIGYPEYGKRHSEPDAWFQCRGILEKDLPWSVVNVRLRRDGKLKMSRPCECCDDFLRRMGCKEVWFSTEDGFANLRLQL